MNDTVLVDVNIGFCETNNLILDENFVWYYQRAYVSMYVICLLVVIVLYVAVFGAVQRQRSRRQKRRSRQSTAATNRASSRTIVTTASERRIPTAQVTEMVMTNNDRCDGGGGVVDGTNVLVIEQDSPMPPAAVQTSKSN